MKFFGLAGRKKIKALSDQVDQNLRILISLTHELSGCVNDLKNKEKIGVKDGERTDKTRVQNDGILAHNRS